MKFSDIQIDIIIDETDSAMRANKINKQVRQSILTTLKSYINKKGINYDVCPVCLGSGKNILNQRS